jgi:hypothetical protein
MKNLLLSGICVLTFSASAQANSFESYSFTGTISTSTYDERGGFQLFGKGIESGDTFTGSLNWTYDTSADTWDSYSPPVYEFEYSLLIKFTDSTIQKYRPVGNVEVINETDSDRLYFFEDNPTSLMLEFISSNGTALPGSGGLPASINSPGLDGGYLGFNVFTADGYSYNVNGNIDTLSTVSSPAPVPIPSTILLLGTGLVGVIGSKLRRKK